MREAEEDWSKKNGRCRLALAGREGTIARRSAEAWSGSSNAMGLRARGCVVAAKGQ